jgi:hypothetical protein
MGGLALTGPDSSDEVVADGQTSNGVGGPALANDPETHNDVETRSGSITGYVVSVGALLAFAVFIVSMLLFRVEVRAEKAAGRARRQRLEYHKDLRRYREQLDAPRRDNT